MNKKTTIIFAILIILSGCVPRSAILKGYDFKQIKRVAVLDFSGPEENSGRVVADEFVRQLMYKGIEVVDRSTAGGEFGEAKEKSNFLKNLRNNFDVDAVIEGTVTEYTPSQKYLVLLGAKSSALTAVVNPIVPISGKTVYNEGTVSGIADSQMITVSATIGVSANLVDTKTAQVVWSSNYTYEGLDIATATENLVAYLLKSLDTAWAGR